MSCSVMTLADVLPWLSPGCESAHERQQVFSELRKGESRKSITFLGQCTFISTHKQTVSSILK